MAAKYFAMLFSGFSKRLLFRVCVPNSSETWLVTNFDMLFLVMGFISLVDEIRFMLISSRYICIR